MDVALLESHARSLREQVALALALELPHDEVDPAALSPLLARLARRLSDGLGVLADLHGPPGTDDCDFERAFEDTPSLPEQAFIAQLELRHYGGWLFEQTGPLDIDRVVTRCERVRRQFVLILSGLEQAICEAIGATSSLVVQVELDRERGRATRRAYYRFIAVIETLTSMHEAGHWGYPSMLWASQAALGELVDDPIYPELRRVDRLRIDRLQQRLLRWSSQPVLDELEARRLWREIEGRTTHLSHVQRRRALVEHDANAAAELLWGAQLERSLSDNDPRLRELGTRSPGLARALGDGRLAEIGRELERVHDALARTLGRPSLAARRSAANVELLATKAVD